MKYIYGYMQWKSSHYEDRNIWKLKDRSPLTLNNPFSNYYGKEELNLKSRLYC